MRGYQVVLGLPWLKMFNPNIDWIGETIILNDSTQVAMTSTEEQDLKKLIPKEFHNKLATKSKKSIFLGYEAPGKIGYRLWDPLVGSNGQKYCS